MLTYTYSIPDIRGHCCVPTVLGAFKDSLFQACTLDVDPLEKTLTLYLDDDDDTFRVLEPRDVDRLVSRELESVGFAIEPRDNPPESTGWTHASWGALGLISGFSLLLLPLVFTSMPLVLVAILSLAGVGLTAALGWSFYRRAYHALWEGAWTMDTLFSISTAVIAGVSLAALFVPGLPMMLEAGLLIFGFRHLGIAIADAFKANLVETAYLQDDAPGTVKRQQANGQVEDVPLESIQPGDTLLLYPGDMLPVDGMFESGAGMISKLYQTGSNQSEAFVCKQRLDAGTKLLAVSGEEALLFRARAAACDSFLAREDQAILDAKLSRAQDKSSPRPNTTAYLLQFFIPTVLVIALISGVAVGVFFGSWILAIQCAVTILVAACPCTLGLIAPLVTHVGVKKAERAGISVRLPEQLEVLNSADTVLVDLNGTFTEGSATVQACVSHDETVHSSETLLALMARLEASEDHWTARAIKQAVGDTTDFDEAACERIALEHHGLRVRLDETEYVLGNRAMMEASGIQDVHLDVSLGLGQSVVYLASAGRLMGHVILEDKLRDGSLQMVRGLRASGKTVCLMTGSDESIASLYATALTIPQEHVFANCGVSGENSKQAHLHALQEAGHTVVMIGDAANDARVVADSDFGLVVAHEAGHEGTQRGAAAVLRSKSLVPVLQLFDIAEKTSSNVHQNIWFSLIYNVVAVLAPVALLFCLGIALNPAVGAALMMLQTLLIFANVYWFDTQEVPSFQLDELSLQPGATPDLNMDVSGVSNGMRFAHTNGNLLDSKDLLDGCGDTVGDGLDELPRAGFN